MKEARNNEKKNNIFFASFFLLSIFLNSTIYSNSQKENKKRERFIIALMPEKNIFEQRRRYAPLAEYMEKKLNLNVELKFLPSYEEVAQKFIEEEVDAAFFGSFAYVQTHILAGVEQLPVPFGLMVVQPLADIFLCAKILK